MSDRYELRRVTAGCAEPHHDDESNLSMEDAWEALAEAKTAAKEAGWTIVYFDPHRFFVGSRTDPKDRYMTVGVHPVGVEGV